MSESSIQEKITAPKKKLKPDNGKRAAKLSAIIDAKLGPSASEVHHFDVALLEKQALTILKLEEDLARSQGKGLTSSVKFIPTIIAACCYI